MLLKSILLFSLMSLINGAISVLLAYFLGTDHSLNVIEYQETQLVGLYTLAWLISSILSGAGSVALFLYLAG